MADVKVEYGSRTVELSRLYPFGETNETDTGKGSKKVTVLHLNELNGNDNVRITKESESGKLIGYLQISASAGITYEEALLLADKDAGLIAKELENF